MRRKWRRRHCHRRRRRHRLVKLDMPRVCCFAIYFPTALFSFPWPISLGQKDLREFLQENIINVSFFTSVCLFVCSFWDCLSLCVFVWRACRAWFVVVSRKSAKHTQWSRGRPVLKEPKEGAPCRRTEQPTRSRGAPLGAENKGEF